VSPGTQGMLFGVGAACAWGFSDYYVAVLARRAGFLRTLVAVQAGSLALLALLLLLVVDVPEPTTGQWLYLAALGPLAVISYMGFYWSLELGPLAIVSPITAAGAAVTLLLAVVLLSEALTDGQAVGCALTLAGVFIAAVRMGALAEGEARVGKGALLALAAMIGFGFYLFALGDLSQDLGYFLPILVTRTCSLVLLVVLVAGRGAWPWERLRGRLLPAALAAGAVEAGGYLLFNRGTELGYVSIVSAAASFYPLIPFLGAVLLLGERIARTQVLGVGVVLSGLLVLGVSG
jgi:drug/metabolite transporter (DMT)-like permease